MQVELNNLAHWLKHTGTRMLVLIEGRDTAGKGGLISAIAERSIPARCTSSHLAKPTERERTQWYFPALCRASAGRRRARALRSQLVQPRRCREGHGVLH